MAAPAGDEENQGALGALMSTVVQALAPVDPPPAFRNDLARDLAAVAEHKKHAEIILQRPEDHRRHFVIGAVVSTLVSLAGLVALLRYRRHAGQQTR
mgnify:CR=1 FL=1